MGVATYTISDGSRKHVLPISAVSIGSLAAACDAESAMFWELMVPTGVPCANIVETQGFLLATTDFVERLEGHRERQRFTYSITQSAPFGAGKGQKIRGGMASVVVEGRPCMLTAGQGLCLLRFADVDTATQEIRYGDQRDLREQSELITDNRGELKISRHEDTLASTFVEKLTELLGFLETCSSDTLTVTYRERRPPVSELVELFAQGGGAGDYAGEALLEMGDKAKEPLAKMLRDSTLARLYPTVANLLEMLSSVDGTEAGKGSTQREEETHEE